MILIEGDYPIANVHLEIERLEGLLADLRRLASGTFPSAADLTGAPVIDAYRMAMFGVPCLVGTVHGHPNLIDGHLVRTSDLWLFAPQQGWARTLSRTYLLRRSTGDELQ